MNRWMPSTGAELRAAGLLIVVIAAVYGVLGSVGISAVVSAGLIWLYISSLSKSSSPLALSAVRFYLPVYFMYNGVSLFAPQLQHGWSIVLMYVGSLLGFAFGWTVATVVRRDGVPSPVVAPHRDGGIFHRRGIWLVLLVTISTFLFAVVKSGGVPAFSANPNVARVTFFDNGIVSTIIVIGTHLLISAGLIDAFLVRGIRAKLAPVFMLISGLLLAFAMSNRGLAINPVVFGLFVVFWLRNLSVRSLLPWGVAGLSLVGIAGYLRNLGSWGTSYVSDLSAQGYSGLGAYLAPVLTYVYGTAQTFGRTIDFFPFQVPFQLGVQFFSPLIHGQSVDLYLKDLFGLDFQGFGLALGSANAFYIDWGAAGVVLGHAVMGLLCGAVYVRARSSYSIKWVAVYCYLLMQLIFSNYGHPFAYLSYVIEPIVVIGLISRRTWDRAIRPPIGGYDGRLGHERGDSVEPPPGGGSVPEVDARLRS